MASVKKIDLVRRVSEQTGLTRKQVRQVIQRTLDNVTDSLAEGHDVVFRNFGSFHAIKRKAKIGRNPKKAGHGNGYSSTSCPKV